MAFYTFGGGCVGRGHTRVDVVGRSAIVTPFDTHSGAEACTAELRFLDHTTEVRIDAPGSGSVTIRGRVEPGDHVVERTFSVLIE